MPLVSPAMAVPAIDRMSVSAALRYENYPGMGEVATPKFGLVLAPTPDFEVKGSWGQSFKAPTLYQQFLAQQTLLFGIAGFGTGYPATATVLYLAGGNAALEPERSTNWTATLGIHPRALPGLELELSYFDIRYGNRVVEPIVSSANVLNNPLFRDLITFSPTLDQMNAAIADARLGLGNNTGRPFEPATVVAIIDNRFRNIAKQSVRGLDASLRYTIDLATGDALNLTGNASYLESRRQLLPTQPQVDIAGILFNPPHFRARAGVSWTRGGLTLASWLSHIGGVTDNRRTPEDEIGGQTTLDVTMRYRTDNGRSALSNIELALTVQNLLNDKPTLIRTDQAYYAPYDSTNYSAIGRFVGATLTKRWR